MVSPSVMLWTDTLNMEVRGTVKKLLVFKIDKQVQVVQKVSTNDKWLDISNDENPGKKYGANRG